jgi:hypothetical protein
MLISDHFITFFPRIIKSSEGTNDRKEEYKEDMILHF